MVTKRVNQSGQAILLVLLAMAVVVTIVLSMLARQVTDIGITNRDEDSIRAFSAAEAGVERRLGDYSLAPLSYSDIPNVSVTGTVSSYGAARVYEYPFSVSSGDVATIWFAEHDQSTGAITCAGGTCYGNQGWFGNNLNQYMNFYFGSQGSTPALQLTFYYANGGVAEVTAGDLTSVRAKRVGFDVGGHNNSFTSCQHANASLNGTTYACRANVCLSNTCFGIADYDLNLTNTQRSGLMFVRAKMLYTSTAQPLAVTSGFNADGSSFFATDFPSQGRLIDAVGSSTSASATRRLSVTNIYSDYPPVLDYGLFVNGGGLTK